MRAYRFVPLRDEAAIEAFIAHYGALATRSPSPPLLRDVFPSAPDLWATFDDQGRMLGGFELVRGSEMTCYTLFDWASTPLADIPASAMVELNCVWLAPELRRSWASIRFWRGLARCLQHRRETHIVFAIDARKPGLERFYRPIIAGHAYSGPFASERVPAGTVYWTTPRHFRFLGFYYLGTYIGRGLASLRGRAEPRH